MDVSYVRGKIKDTLIGCNKSIQPYMKEIADLKAEIRNPASTFEEKDAKQARINKARRMIEDKKTAAIKDCNTVLDSYQESLRKEDRLNPAEITDDAKLFSLGVKLSEKDYYDILEKNNGNRTMTQLTFKAAEQNGIQLKGYYTGNNQEIQAAEDMRSSLSIMEKWLDNPNGAAMIGEVMN